MPVPTEEQIQDFMLRFNKQVGDLSQLNTDLTTFRRWWANLTAAQQTGVKNLTSTKISDAITALTALRTEISGF
jgi:hypothetical protein